MAEDKRSASARELSKEEQEKNTSEKIKRLIKKLQRKYPETPILEVTKEKWSDNLVRVGALSRLDWKARGARVALVQLAFQRFVEEGCNYNVLNGGLVDRKSVKAVIGERLAGLTPKERRDYKEEIEEAVLAEIAKELNSVIPFIKKPAEFVKGSPFVRLYISTSLILDNYYGQRVAELLQAMRPDIRLLKERSDRTRLKGVGRTEKEKKAGQTIHWLNPGKHRLPGQYASTAVDKEIEEEEAAAESLPALWSVAGHGVSISKPGDGEKKVARFSLPVLNIPTPGKPGEPSIALNQIGVRIIEAHPDGVSRVIRTWTFRDLTANERQFITGKKEGIEPIHERIIEAIKADKRGLTIGELADALEVSRETVERKIKFLVESKALNRTTWPGLYKDESERYNFHRDWLQARLRYPWNYDKDYHELRRLLFGCMHAGYTITDYEYIRNCLPEIILNLNIEVLELIGDIIAGLKHNLIHRGQIIGNMNYTDQEIFAGELVGTVIYDVFTSRFRKSISADSEEEFKKKVSELKREELEAVVRNSLILFLYIVGNHDGWQKDVAITPGKTFRSVLLEVLQRGIESFLENLVVYIPKLYDVIESKVIELPESNAVYTFPGGICTELVHPGMARTKTISIRCEEALAVSSCQMVDIANFHVAVEVEKWGPELGERVATQVGTMVIHTDFEKSKLKRVDFGPVYVGIRHKDGKIFMVEHQFFNQPILKQPISRKTNIDELKSSLKLLRSSLDK